jgi:DNA-directed RNA polymerase subunit RPC12/RpoP
VFWGGRFNPIIPCDDRELAKALIAAFNVDALYNVSGGAAADTCIRDFPYIRWPEFHPELFVDYPRGKEPTVIDVAHPARRLFETHVDRRDKPDIDTAFYQWQDTDPLRHVFQATFGAYPAQNVIGHDYAQLFQRALAATPTALVAADALPDDLFRKLTPNYLTTIDLEASRLSSSNWGEPGFYYGKADDFTDLVNFWNLRASDIDIFFYDAQHHTRLQPFVQAFAEVLRSRPKSNHLPGYVSVWQKDRDLSADMTVFGAGVSLCTFDAGLFNGMNLNPPLMAFPDKSALGTSVENNLGTSVTFQLPEKPFSSDPQFHSQMVVASVSASNIGNTMLTPPFIPQLNEYYGRKAYFLYDKARSERGRLGIILNATRDQLTLRALPFTEVISKIFETFGIEAQPSPAGLVSACLIDRMAGLQGCRVFKIAGVRSLIKKYRPNDSFDRTEAVTMIGNNDPVTHQPRFDAYKSLFIEAREKAELKPEDAFLYLLKTGVFRAGLKFACPACRLDFWLSLDDAGSKTQCPYCGFEFSVLTQLRDRNWAYRRSGLFGREDHQGGGIPVAVTLQQLDTMLHDRLLAYAPGIELRPQTAAIEKCEADFVLLASSFPRSDKPLELGIAECKDIAWHNAAKRRHRQVAFDDFLAAAEWLIETGRAEPRKLGIFGGSNSGLLVGAAMTQRPELFRAVVCMVPLLDMLRYHMFDNAQIWKEEFGTADDSEDFAALLGYSPYHSVRDGTAYPATMIVSGDSDQKCNPLHARKMTAPGASPPVCDRAGIAYCSPVSAVTRSRAECRRQLRNLPISLQPATF